jgi:2-methylcitrate dehydratase PrpD
MKLELATPLTRELGDFIAGLRYEEIPAEALPVIHTGFTDCIGVMIAGRNEPAPQILKQVLAPAPGKATLLFGTETASAPEAAWINGTAAHALDFDDVAHRAHPSTVLVPAILAEAETLGVSGRRMVTAYAAGYEVWAELNRRDADQYHSKGWHPTGIFGAIAAAAACASLRGLDAEHAAYAISIGASQSSGVFANFGSMTKPFHAGRASHSGVIAARLAAAGFTASIDTIEHPQGFLAAVSPAGRVNVASPVEAGRQWKLPRLKLSVKKYPLCFCTHRALDGILDLLKATPIDAGRVRRVIVSISPGNAKILRNHLPQTGLEAKFSMEFAIASALIARAAGLVELSDDFVRRANVQQMMQRVTIEIDDREDPNTPGYAPYDLVTIETDDGRRFTSHQVTQVRGGPGQPLSRDELWSKFTDCLKAGAMSAPALPLFDALMSLDQLPDMSRLPGLQPN